MGQQTAVVSKSGKNTNQSLRLKIDVPLLLVTITLVVFGALVVYSASWNVSIIVSGDDSPAFMFSRQMMWLGLGLAGMAVLIFIDYHILQRLALWGMAVTILALLAVLIFGDETRGTFSGGSYQPSELAKLMVIIYLAVWLYAKRDYLSDVNFGLIPLGAIVGIVGGLILSQPDISAAGTILILGGIMFFLAGGDVKQIAFLLVISLIFGLLVVQFNATGRERVDDYLTGIKDPMASSYHVKNALSAFAKGGWFGVGLGRSTTKFGVLPVPHTDSIFAIIGEEFGIFGTLTVVSLFGVLLWRGLTIARKAPDELGALLAGGLTIWIVMESFLNMLAILALVPFAGNTLPLFSIGGSSLVSTLVAIGILLNVSRQSVNKELETERRTFSEIIDLRGWDRRRRVSRSHRARRTQR